MKGKIKAVSKTGGVLLEGSDKWLNPKDAEVRKKITRDLVGKEVELEVSGNKILGVKSEDNNKPDQAYWERKDRIIVRQNALAHATALAVNFIKDKNLNDIVEDVKFIAETLEEWVMR